MYESRVYLSLDPPCAKLTRVPDLENVGKDDKTSFGRTLTLVVCLGSSRVLFTVVLEDLV